MKVCSFLIAGAALCTLAGSPAFAADMGMPTKAPFSPAPPPYNWTGFYVGVNVGGGWADASATATLAGFTAGASETLSGVIGGGQIGYNWQTGPLVLGIEADIQGSGQQTTTNVTAVGVTFSETDKLPYFGTVRGRIGYAFDRWLPYFTGGWGYGELNSSLTATAPITGSYSASTSHSAWVVGGGVEVALWGNWSGKVEYLYSDTGTITRTYATPAGILTESGSVTDNIVRVGLNYRF